MKRALKYEPSKEVISDINQVFKDHSDAFSRARSLDQDIVAIRLALWPRREMTEGELREVEKTVRVRLSETLDISPFNIHIVGSEIVNSSELSRGVRGLLQGDME